MSYDYDRPFVERENLSEYVATDKTVARHYGSVILATGLSNKEYNIRYQRMSNDRRMKPPSSSLRIFPGYLAVRNLGTPSEYETWIPNHAFEEIYRKCGQPDSDHQREGSFAPGAQKL